MCPHTPKSPASSRLTLRPPRPDRPATKCKDLGLPSEQVLQLLRAINRSPTSLAKSLNLTPGFIGQVILRQRRSERVEAAVAAVLSQLGHTRESIWGTGLPPGRPKHQSLEPTAPTFIGPMLARFGLTAATGIPLPARHHLGLVVDCETTGFHPERHALLEVAAVAFVYVLDPSGTARVLGVLRQYEGLQDPKGAEVNPISMRVNRINLEEAAGKSFDLEALRAVSSGVDAVFAHNAAFDRPFLVKLAPWLDSLPWHCSMRGIDWKGLGFAKKSLGSLCEGFQIPTPDHRALADALATLRLLATEATPGQSLLGQLLVQSSN